MQTGRRSLAVRAFTLTDYFVCRINRLFRVARCEFRQWNWNPLVYATEFSRERPHFAKQRLGPDGGGDDGDPDDNGNNHP
jgi:hypothetical protein